MKAKPAVAKPKPVRALLVGFLLFATIAAAMTVRSTPSVRLIGGTDLEMLDKVRAALGEARMHGRHQVSFTLISPGGSVVPALEIAREIRDAYDRDGIVVEIHAQTLCASGCTFVLAAGTPGHRFINPATLFLVHPIQSGRGCLENPPVPVEQDEKVVATMYGMLRDAYVRYTSQSPEVVQDWLICGKERVGRGMLAVDMHIADAVEK